MVHVQKRLVQVGQVKVVLCFVVLGKRLVLWRRELAERRQVCVHIGDVEAVRLVKVPVPGREREFERRHAASAAFTADATVVPRNDDRILVVLQLEGEGVLLGVLSGRNARASLRPLYVLHEHEVHV